MSYGIRCAGVPIEIPGIQAQVPEGAWLRKFEDTPDGRGRISWTYDPRLAMKFEDASEALTLWRKQSEFVPLRPDGKPNRPLTAFTIEITPLPVI